MLQNLSIPQSSSRHIHGRIDLKNKTSSGTLDRLVGSRCMVMGLAVGLRRKHSRIRMSKLASVGSGLLCAATPECQWQGQGRNPKPLRFWSFEFREARNCNDDCAVKLGRSKIVLSGKQTPRM